ALGHNHDADYAGIAHLHDDRYPLIGHDHDADYSDIAHLHDERYPLINHDHDSDYAAIVHDHDGVYAPFEHLLDSEYSQLGHDHDGDYSPTGHSHASLSTPNGVIADVLQVEADTDIQLNGHLVLENGFRMETFTNHLRLVNPIPASR